MTAEMSPTDTAKRAAALRACQFVEDGMKIGLGTGSTAAWMVRGLGALVRDDGLRITAVATSARTADLARSCGIDVVDLEAAGRLDLTIDGADEIDDALDLVKGGGGAHLREKIVARASDRMIAIADRSKRVRTLGAFPLPVEVVPFGWSATRRLLEGELAALDVPEACISIRMAGKEPFRTDEGNLIFDLSLGRIGDAAGTADALNRIPGVVENGLFVGICGTAILGDADGGTEVIDMVRDGGRPRDVSGTVAGNS